MALNRTTTAMLGCAAAAVALAAGPTFLSQAGGADDQVGQEDRTFEEIPAEEVGAKPGTDLEPRDRRVKIVGREGPAYVAAYPNKRGRVCTAALGDLRLLQCDPRGEPDALLVAGSFDQDGQPYLDGTPEPALVWGMAPAQTVQIVFERGNASVSFDVRHGGSDLGGRAFFLGKYDLSLGVSTVKALDQRGDVVATAEAGGTPPEVPPAPVPAG